MLSHEVEISMKYPGKLPVAETIKRMFLPLRVGAFWAVLAAKKDRILMEKRAKDESSGVPGLSNKTMPWQQWKVRGSDKDGAGGQEAISEDIWHRGSG